VGLYKLNSVVEPPFFYFFTKGLQMNKSRFAIGAGSHAPLNSHLIVYRQLSRSLKAPGYNPS
jgi:hypothetical protein